MDDRAIGIAIRALRQRRRWRQEDLARRADVRLWRIARIEAGDLDPVGVRALRAVARALDADVSLRLRWRGEELDRLLNAAHSRLHEVFATRIYREPGWILAPEVSFSVFGERGVIDAILWHPECRILAVVELKTAIVDVQEALGTLDRKVRLARRIVAPRGWRPAEVGAWLVVSDTRTNRSRVSAHRAVLRASLPDDGRQARRWLRAPQGSIRCLSFLQDPRPTASSRRIATVRRVRRPSAEARSRMDGRLAAHQEPRRGASALGEER